MAGFCIKAAFAALALAAVPASSAIIINAVQVGNDVVVTGGGSYNLAGLTKGGTSPFGPSFSPPQVLRIGPGPNSETYGTLTGPSFFGTASTNPPAFSTSGDHFGILALVGNSRLYLPVGYVSGAALSGSSTYANTTIAALGGTPGTYVWTSSADSLTLNIGASVAGGVPEPAIWATMIGGFGLVGGVMRQRRRQAVVVATA